MKIIIVGGGIAGLSTYLHLRKHLPNQASHTITIYESHKYRSVFSTGDTPDDTHPLNLDTLSESTAIVGGGLGISPNGMRVLRDLDPELHANVVAQGFPAEKFVFKGANGWTLGVQSTSDKAWIPEGEQEEVCIASSRHGLWETIMRHVRHKYGDDVIQYKKVLGVEREGRLQVRYADEHGNEQTSEADLIIGADGVKSVVRAAVFGDDPKYQPIYTGQAGVGGFLTSPIPPSITNTKSMIFTFGGSGFFGYTSSAPLPSNQLMWWSTFETNTLPDATTADIKAALLKRHHHWADPVLQDIIRKADVRSVYPTWTMPDVPRWGEKGVLLVGDAAHAVDPSTGQGASLALEDAQCLGLVLAGLMGDEVGGGVEKDRECGDVVGRLVYGIRAPRVRAVVERGKKIAGSKASVGVVREYLMYVVLWLMMRFPVVGKALLGDVNRDLYTWSARKEVDKALDVYRNSLRK